MITHYDTLKVAFSTFTHTFSLILSHNVKFTNPNLLFPDIYVAVLSKSDVHNGNGNMFEFISSRIFARIVFWIFLVFTQLGDLCLCFSVNTFMNWFSYLSDLRVLVDRHIILIIFYSAIPILTVEYTRFT